ncbi:hypothetical protein [Bacillus cereus]|uniref:hypothetical protein n=1 Tax=Bacillus cereus TaxID=1396 RepID=UPI00027AB6DB|nr:hypothetical protein [Bacillus cereus]EJS63418.1 hypothetical protein ICY_05255 [Bacillus cereus BAG2X1-3]
MNGFYIKKDGEEADISAFVSMLVKVSAKMIPYLSLKEFEEVLEILSDEELENFEEFIKELDQKAVELRETNERRGSH